MTTKSPLREVIASVNSRKELEEKLWQKTHELSQAQNEHDSLVRSLPAAREKVGSLTDTVARDGETGIIESRFAEQLAQAKAELRELERQRDDAKARRERLAAEREELLQQFAKSDKGATRECLLEHAAEIEATQRRVTEIRERLAEHQAVAAPDEADNADLRIEALQSRREELLADQALGEDRSREIEALDAEIAALVSDGDGTQAAALEQWRQGRQTIAGLERRLEVAEAELARQRALTPKLIDQYLIAEAEATGREYRRHAAGLILAFERLVIIERLISVTGERRTPAIAHDRVRDLHLQIPAFKIQALEGMARHDKQTLYSSHRAGAAISRAEAAERERLQELVGFEP